MNQELIKRIVTLRVAIAFLGEKEQANWWPSSFLSRSGESFLSPVFPKTAPLARVSGASAAAQVSHDEHIGIGDVFHLFRLPENIEHDISQSLAADGSVLEVIASEESAKDALKELAAGETLQGVGPLLLEQGGIDQPMLTQMASAYLQAFGSGAEHVYPYYRSNV